MNYVIRHITNVTVRTLQGLLPDDAAKWQLTNLDMIPPRSVQDTHNLLLGFVLIFLSNFLNVNSTGLPWAQWYKRAVDGANMTNQANREQIPLLMLDLYDDFDLNHKLVEFVSTSSVMGSSSEFTLLYLIQPCAG